MHKRNNQLNIMKVNLIIILALIFFLNISAQTQHGIVKTRGRMVNGQLVTGTKLSGVTITLNFGNSLVSGSQGAFSFNVPSGKNYSLISAIKKGYTMSDPEYTKRSFTYSESNPFFIVLEDENQRLADLNAAIRKVRKTLTAQLEKREEEIEALKAKNILTEEEYQQRLQQLYDNQSKSEQLVKEMAERYASIDYDQLNAYNQQVQNYIEEGELQKADSLIRAKGSLEQRVAEYLKVVEANRKERFELSNRNKLLELSETGAQRTYEELSQDLFRCHEIYLQKYQQDSALYCLKTRADLDSSNVEAIRDYALLCYKQTQYLESEIYFKKANYIYLNNNDSLKIAINYNNLGLLYNKLYKYNESEDNYNKALKIIECLFQQNQNLYREQLTQIQNNLASLYYLLKDYTKSEYYFTKALKNREVLYDMDPTANRISLAGLQTNIGSYYYGLNEFTKSEFYFLEALKQKEFLNDNPDSYRDIISITQMNLGKMYRSNHDLSNAEKYLNQALENYELLFSLNPNAYRIEMSRIHNELGILYSLRKEFDKSIKFFNIALENYNIIYLRNPNAFRHEMSVFQLNLGNVYYSTKDYNNAKLYYNLALKNKEILFKQNPDIYRTDLALIYNNIGSLYCDLQDLSQSIKYIKLSVEIREQLFNANPSAYRPQLASSQSNLGILYRDINANDSSIYYLNQAVIHRKILYKESPNKYSSLLAKTLYNLSLSYMNAGENEEALLAINNAIELLPTSIDFYETKGIILLRMKKNDEALGIWNKIIELNPDYQNNLPKGSNLSKELKQLNLI